MDLIDRAALLKDLGEPHTLDYNAIATVCKVKEHPTIEAVPLDKLCEWLASWDEQAIPCSACSSVFRAGRCPRVVLGFVCGSTKHWKMLIRKWMEEQHG